MQFAGSSDFQEFSVLGTEVLLRDYFLRKNSSHCSFRFILNYFNITFCCTPLYYKIVVNAKLGKCMI